jgi:hypothetical protein
MRDEWQTSLPGPEEPITEGVHARHGKLLQPSLDGSIPLRRVLPETAITPIRMAIGYAIEEQTTIVKAVTELARVSDAEGRSTRKM